MSDIKLRIRHAKRGNEKTLDLSGLGLTDIPVDITQLTMLETLNVSNNKLKSLARVEQLPNLREINASNNQILALHIEIQEMYCLDSLNLVGNPVVNTCPDLANIRCNETAIQTALSKYFGGGGGAPALGSSASMTSINQRDTQDQKFAASVSSGQGSAGKSYNSSMPTSSNGGTAQTLRPMASTTMLNQGSYGASNAPVGGVRSGVGKPTFLSQEQNVNQDEATMRRRIMELELENNKLKMGGSMNSNATGGTQDRDWMSSFGGSQGAAQTAAPVQMARPMTASSSNQKVRELENTLKEERKHQKRLQDNIESLKKELGKQNFSQFTGNGKEVSVTDGRLPQVPGVREIALDDLDFGDQIGQGGFSVIHKGFLNGTPVAIKKIFDPKITDDLLAEIQNEIVMTAILRHPNIALLMGVAPKIPNIAIVSEYVDQGSLYELLHMKKNIVKLDMNTRLRFALDAGRAFQYMHQLGIVHRDIKSMNVLVCSNMQIKVCDFGLARFKADLGKGSMQYAGTPVYMAPELFQKRQYDEGVDVFAFGALLWECITREVPYDGLEAIDIRQKVEKGEPLKLPYDSDQRLAQLINACRQVQSSQRPSFDQIVGTLSQVLQF